MRDVEGGGVEGLVVFEVGAKDRAKHKAMGVRDASGVRRDRRNHGARQRRQMCRAKVESNREKRTSSCLLLVSAAAGTVSFIHSSCERVRVRGPR